MKETKRGWGFWGLDLSSGWNCTPINHLWLFDSIISGSKLSVDMTELQASASEYISKITGSESAYVTSGASAGLTMAAAAILAGLDPAKMENLPSVKNDKNEFIISREHRNGYDHAFRLAGGETIEVGMNEIL